MKDLQGEETPQGDPLAVHYFCVHSGSTLMGDNGVSRTVECDFLSVLSIYPRMFFSEYPAMGDHPLLLEFLSVLIVYCLLLGISRCGQLCLS